MIDPPVAVNALNAPIDPAFPIVSDICRVVPASRWVFARVGLHGDVEMMLASDENGYELTRVQCEFNLQREKVKVGPRIAATLGPLGGFESGITLLFADAYRAFGILMLLRTAALGPFTSTEISRLSFALSTGSDRFSGLHLRARGRLPTAQTAKRVETTTV